MGKGHAGKVAVITGAASGLGQAFARRLAEDGVDIVIADRQDAAATVALVQAAGRAALAVPGDVTQPDDVARLAATATERFGGCDILVNNAGIFPNQPFEAISFAEWRRVLSINLDALFLVSQAFLPAMRQRGWGRIVNLASNTFAQGVTGYTHYIASKGGVIGFTRALASEVGAQGITVNAIAPGLTRTPGTTAMPEDRFAHLSNIQAVKRTELPEDLVGALSFLTSDDAGFITGQTLYVDGGLVRA